MDNQIKKLTNRAVLIHCILMIIALGVTGTMSFLVLRIDWIIIHISIIVLLHIVWLIIIIKTDSDDKPFLIFYYVFMIIYMFPFILLLWQIQVYCAMLFYMLLPLILFFRTNNLKHAAYASMSSMLFVIAIIIISEKTIFFQISENIHLVAYLNMFVIIMGVVCITTYLYFSLDIFKSSYHNSKSLTVKPEEKEQKAEVAKLKELYNSAVIYLEQEQPYRQQNYRLPMFAADLNTNTKYLSEAINIYYGGTFESLLNKYRLEFVKKMLDEGLADKYTMEYIYTSAGYSSRAAFYNNFRKTFNMSPLNYQEIQKQKTINVSE